MTNIVLHLGLHKTGTSFLQAEIFPKIKNVNIPRNGAFRYGTKIDENKLNIISDEELSVNPHLPPYHFQYLGPNQRFVIAERLNLLFPKAKIILGIREKNSWLRSVYSQYVKGGGIHNYDNFIKNVFDKDFLNFEKYIQHLKTLFKDVLIYHFEDLKKDPNNFVKNICDFIGVDVPSFENKIYEKGWSNRQLNLGLFLNRFFYSEYNPNGGFLIRTKIFNPRFLIDHL
jgi:hypothetical protein